MATLLMNGLSLAQAQEGSQKTMHRNIHTERTPKYSGILFSMFFRKSDPS